MNSSIKMALWTTFNVWLETHGRPPLRLTEVRKLWALFGDELNLEKWHADNLTPRA